MFITSDYEILNPSRLLSDDLIAAVLDDRGEGTVGRLIWTLRLGGSKMTLLIGGVQFDESVQSNRARRRG